MNRVARSRGRAVAVLSALAIGATLYTWMAEFVPQGEYSADGPPPYAISKETTYITQPLRPDGSVDYVAALNARLSEGVTPENNAAVLLLKVMGSGAIDPEIREEFYRHLGVPMPESTAGALQPYSDFLRDHLKSAGESLTDEEFQNLHLDTFHESYGKPWKLDRFPLVAFWLVENEEAINLIVEASERPKLFVPIVPKDMDQGLLDAWMFEFNSNMRNFARILPSRFMYALGEGRIEAAQRDMLALHRLARLLGSGSSIIDYLVATALDDIACANDLEMAMSQHVTSDQLANYRKELSKLPTFAAMSEMYDVRERWEFLDLVRTLEIGSRLPEAEGRNIAADVAEFMDCPQVEVWKRFPDLEFDWDSIRTIGNLRFDQVVAALKQPAFERRIAGLKNVEAEIMQLRKESQDPSELDALLKEKKPASEVISRQFGHELAGMNIENSRIMGESEVRGRIRRQMHLVALALAEYRLDKSDYPKELGDLLPKYLKTIPQDGFTDKPLKYQKQQAGYLLYSAGPNGRDDRGENDRYSPVFDGDDGRQYADDIAVRVPRVPDR